MGRNHNRNHRRANPSHQHVAVQQRNHHGVGQNEPHGCRFGLFLGHVLDGVEAFDTEMAPERRFLRSAAVLSSRWRSAAAAAIAVGGRPCLWAERQPMKGPFKGRGRSVDLKNEGSAAFRPGWRSWWRVGLIGHYERTNRRCLRHPKVAGSNPAPGTTSERFMDGDALGLMDANQGDRVRVELETEGGPAVAGAGASRGRGQAPQVGQRLQRRHRLDRIHQPRCWRLQPLMVGSPERTMSDLPHVHVIHTGGTIA